MASLYLRGRKYWITYRYRGVVVRKSLNTTSRPDALLLKNQIENALITGKHKIPHIGIVQHKLAELPWIAQRWNRMSDREKQAVIFCLFEGKCFHCGCELSLPQNLDRYRANKIRLVLDHVIPFSCGGSDDHSNFVASCYECNAKRSDGAIKNPDLRPMVAL